MLLFKYVSNFDYILNDGYIRATQLSALNDPFEANYDKEGLRQLVREIDDFMTRDIVEYIEEEKHKIGVISFSESKDNLLMWSHYANEHKGGLITFNFYKDSIIKDLPIHNDLFEKSVFDGKCKSVKYRKQPIYKIDTFDRDYSNIGLQVEERFVYEIFEQKSDEWIYEKEHRIVLKLEQAHRVVIDTKDIEKYKYKDIYWFKNLLSNTTIFEVDFIEFIGEKLYIYLENIEDKQNRIVIGNSFTSLAKENPNIVFLFKISTSSIQSIAYGHRNENMKRYDIKDKYLYFEMFKTYVDQSNYTLKFQNIKQ
ncbi:MAG: DUF2971 domain-containing protein [Arcobacteraceae bacterium]